MALQGVLAFLGKDVSLMSKSMGILETTFGGFVPETIGVGQIKSAVPTIVFKQKATRSLGVPNTNGVLHASDVVHSYQLA